MVVSIEVEFVIIKTIINPAAVFVLLPVAILLIFVVTECIAVAAVLVIVLLLVPRLEQFVGVNVV